MNRKFPLSHLACVLMAAASAEAGSAQSTGGGQAPSTNDPAVAGATATDKKPRAPKNPENILDIINGRLPLPLVYMIRFDKLGAMTTADAAKAFGTSNGKVFDIKKGRNFGYIDASYKPSAEEVTAAKAWCETGKTAKGKSLAEAGGKPTEILAALGAMGTATAEEVAARNWQVRQVGQPGAAAPAAAPAAAGAQATQTAEKPAGAKLF